MRSVKIISAAALLGLAASADPNRPSPHSTRNDMYQRKDMLREQHREDVKKEHNSEEQTKLRQKRASMGRNPGSNPNPPVSPNDKEEAKKKMLERHREETLKKQRVEKKKEEHRLEKQKLLKKQLIEEKLGIKHRKNGKGPTKGGLIPEIVGGDEIEPYSRPHLVGVGLSLLWHPICGGTLITPQVVLTAAHCLIPIINENDVAWVDINRHDITDDAGVIRVNLMDSSGEPGSDLLVHPEYDGFTADNDFGLMFLPKPVADVTPATINEDPNVPVSGQHLEAVGWGSMQNDFGPYPDTPYNATLGYLTNDECTSPPYDWDPNFISSNMMCAINTGKSICFGDSGGPLTIVDGMSPPTIVGVSSFVGDYECYQPTLPSGFARVSAAAEWIKSSVCKKTGEMCDDGLTPTPSPTHAGMPGGKSGKASGKSGKIAKADRRRN